MSFFRHPSFKSSIELSRALNIAWLCFTSGPVIAAIMIFVFHEHLEFLREIDALQIEIFLLLIIGGMPLFLYRYMIKKNFDLERLHPKYPFRRAKKFESIEEKKVVFYHKVFSGHMTVWVCVTFLVLTSLLEIMDEKRDLAYHLTAVILAALCLWITRPKRKFEFKDLNSSVKQYGVDPLNPS